MTTEVPVQTPIRSRAAGFRDLYIAKIKENTALTYSTETPVKLARAVKAKISHKFTSEKVYSDDGVEDTVQSYEGTEVDIDVNALAPQDRAALFGMMYENGFLVGNKDDIAPEVALGYRVKRLNKKYEFVWLYAGKFASGLEENYETQEDKVKTQTASLKGSFYERNIDGNYINSVDEGNLIAEYSDAKAAIENWFSKVQEPKKAAG